MDKSKAAQHLTSLIFAFMRENEYIDADVIEEIHWSGDIEHINDIAHHKISVCCASAIRQFVREEVANGEQSLLIAHSKLERAAQ
jgi:hypothetical protein